MKTCHDVIASEGDWMRLCARLDTKEDGMATELDAMGEMDPMTRVELNIKMSLFREGFKTGVDDQLSERTLTQEQIRKMNDADFAAGYSAGSAVAEQALVQYQALLEGNL